MPCSICSHRACASATKTPSMSSSLSSPLSAVAGACTACAGGGAWGCSSGGKAALAGGVSAPFCGSAVAAEAVGISACRRSVAGSNAKAAAALRPACCAKASSISPKAEKLCASHCVDSGSGGGDSAAESSAQSRRRMAPRVATTGSKSSHSATFCRASMRDQMPSGMSIGALCVFESQSSSARSTSIKSPRICNSRAAWLWRSLKPR